MVIPENMKLNKFRPVHIPSNSDYFARFGNVNPLSNQFSGEDFIPDHQSKMEQIIQADNDYRNQLGDAAIDH